MVKVKFTVSLLLLSLSLWWSATAVAQGTAFTYQGKLTDNGNLANGNYDLQCKLFDTATVGTGTPQGSTVAVSNVTVSNGIFTVQLDFGACPTCFDGSARFLEIAVRPTGGGSFTTLTPRQPITSIPHAINAAQLGGLPASGFLQNSTSQQVSSNFNISGIGTANILNATTQFNLNGQQVLSAAGTNNLFAGIGAGTNPNNTGNSNSFFGNQAGNANTTGNNNAFFGYQAGQANTGGFSNAFFGNQAGQANTFGGLNAFFGMRAGNANTIGQQNSFFGASAGLHNNANNNSFFGFLAGQANTSGSFNAFFGASAGSANTTGSNNTIFGNQAGQSNTTANGNAFFGFQAGQANTIGFNNAFFGLQAGMQNTGNFNAFFGALAGQANTTGIANSFFGTSAGEANTAGNNNAFFGNSAGFQSTTGSFNAFFGTSAGQANTTGRDNAFFGEGAGSKNTAGLNNTFIGSGADFDVFNPTGDNNTLLGFLSKVTSGNSNATAFGFRAQVSQSNSLILGAINGVNNCTAANNCASVNVGIGTTAPAALLDVQLDGGAFPETALFTTFGSDNKVLGRAIGGSRSALVATPSGRDLLQLGGTGYDGANFVSSPKATILIEAAEAWTSTAQGTRIRFNTTLNGTTTLSSTPRLTIEDDGSVGIGTASPADLLHVNGILRLQTLGAAGSTSLCRNASNQIATCSSSLRYKTAIQPFVSGLDIVNRLRPITFTWKQSGIRDLGFVAEEVAKVEPLFTFTNDKGEVEGVKYDRLSVLLINAVKEQQAQIERQQAETESLQRQVSQQRQLIEQQQKQVEALKRLVCKSNPDEEICKP